MDQHPYHTGRSRDHAQYPDLSSHSQPHAQLTQPHPYYVSSTPTSPSAQTHPSIHSTQAQYSDFQPYYNYNEATPSTAPQYANYATSENSQGPGSSAGEDPDLKRIRNTAASARFRAKKKKREQSLERNAREKRELLANLEARIKELEAENNFLKGLIFDKEKLDAVKEELDRVRSLKDNLEQEEEEERNDGVGT